MNYEQILSRRIQDVKPSGIRRFFDILEEMKDAISLGIGEPDFPTPWHIRDAGIYSLEKGFTKYTSNAGLAELRREIASYLARRFGLHYHFADQILVTVGGSEGIDLAIRCLVNPGDEVIVPVPSFVCYGPLVEMAGGTPVYLEMKAENEFRLTADELRSAITDKTKALVLPFPSNPTGGIMERADLEALAEVLRGTDIMVISDEIYAELTYGGQRHVSMANLPDMYERTIVVNGFSKAYSMTGWRHGLFGRPRPGHRPDDSSSTSSVSCLPPPPASMPPSRPCATATTTLRRCGTSMTAAAAIWWKACGASAWSALSPRALSTYFLASDPAACPPMSSVNGSCWKRRSLSSPALPSAPAGRASCAAATPPP